MSPGNRLREWVADISGCDAFDAVEVTALKGGSVAEVWRFDDLRRPAESIIAKQGQSVHPRKRSP